MTSFITVVIALFLIAIMIIAIDLYVRLSTKKQIIKDAKYDELPELDCIINLGAGIWGNRPSHMLEDRLLEGINLYNNKVSSKLLMRGDHGRKEHDEVNLTLAWIGALTKASLPAIC